MRHMAPEEKPQISSGARDRFTRPSRHPVLRTVGGEALPIETADSAIGCEPDTAVPILRDAADEAGWQAIVNAEGLPQTVTHSGPSRSSMPRAKRTAVESQAVPVCGVRRKVVRPD